MGTGTSTLSAIDSLSSSLQEIERKLAVLEDSHLHHEKTICFDDNVIVSGKRIQCRSGIKLEVGPVLGIVTSNGVRVLVEVDSDCEVTMNFFVIDELNTEARFQREDRFVAKKNTPIARTFIGLVPNTRYAMYIGGLDSSETLLNYATFTTLPVDDSDVRVIFTHGSRVDRICPGEINLMNKLDEVLCDTGVHMGYTSTNLFRELKDLGVNKNDLGDLGIIPTGNRSSLTATPIHLIVHNGDALSVDHELRGKVMELIDVIIRDDMCNDTWKSLLTQLEESLRRLYRSVFNNPTVKNISRRCGNLFIAGQGESGMCTSSLLAMGPKQLDDDEGEATEDSPEITAGDVPTVGNQVRKSKEKEVAQRDNKTILFEDLRQLLLGAIERLTRRVCWSYYRQLWDENFEALDTEDCQREVLQRNILHTRKLLYVKSNMLSYLDRTRKKLLGQFDAEYSAHVQVVNRIKIVKEEIDALESTVKQIIKDMAIFNNVVRERPNGACISMGTLLLLFIETAWGWILPDGAMQVKLVNRDVAIHPDLIVQLEGHIAEGKGITVEAVKKRAVAIVTPFSFLPADDQGDNIPFNEPQMFGLSGMDRRTILRLCAKWQQSDADRAVLIAGSCDGVAVEGWAFPTSILDQNGDDDTTRNQILAADGWDEKRSRMKHILIGRMDKRSKGKSESKIIKVTPGYSPGSGIVSDQSSTFSSEYDTMSITVRRSFWDVSLNAATPSVQKPNGEVIVGQPACFRSSCITDARNHKIVIGPIIGQVTSTTANVLLEIGEDGHVELMCKDKITGLEYYTSMLLKARRPGIFKFDKLIPNHPYDVLLLSSCKLSDPVELDITIASPLSQASAVQRVVYGSFTTPSAPVDAVKYQDKLVKFNLREQVHNKGGAVWANLSTLAGNHSTVPPICRLYVIGASKPSWVKVLPQQDTEDIDNSRLGNDRIYLGDGIKLSRALVDVFSRSWSGIDLIIHCDYSADIVATMNTVLSSLSRAEEISTRAVIPLKSPGGQFISENTHQQQKEISNLIAYAEENIRNAYRIHWGGSSSSKLLLAHGAHLFVSSPMFDILTAMNATSLRELQRDLSPFVCEHLLNMVTNVNSDYQSNLWDSNSHPCKYFAQGKVGVFTLRPKVVLQQENFGSITDNLLPEEQISSLINALHPEVDGDMMSVLMLVSPIPLVTEDTMHNDGSLLGNLQKGITYTTKETLRLLDILSEWLEDKSKNRQVIIVTGGVTIGRCTTIECELNDTYYYDGHPPQTDDGQEIPSKVTVSIQQLCCGSLVGVPGDDVIRPSGALHSMYRSFKYEHTRHINSAHCGLIELLPQQGSYNSNIDFLFMLRNQLNKGAMGAEMVYTPPTGVISDKECDAIWNRVLHCVSGDYKNNDADQLISSIRFCCEDSKDVFTCAHKLYREKSNFGMPSNGGIVVEETFLAVNHWILSHMSSNYQKICPLGSTFVIRQLWAKFCVTEHPPLRAESGFVDKEPLSESEILAITLNTDVEVFTNFVCQIMEHQALVELFAYQMAQLD